MKHPFQVRLEDHQYLFIKKFAAINNMSEAAIIRDILQKYINQTYERFSLGKTDEKDYE